MNAAKLNYGYTMVNEGLAICPLFLPEGGQVVGVEGNDVCVAVGNRETRVALPFYEGAACSVQMNMVPTPQGDVPVYILIPDERGVKQMKVSLECVRRQWYAVCSVVKRH